MSTQAPPEQNVDEAANGSEGADEKDDNKLSPELQARKDAAAVEKAEADAAKAQADANKSEADARKAQAEADDHDMPEARNQRDAEARKASAQADKDAADARTAQIS